MSRTESTCAQSRFRLKAGRRALWLRATALLFLAALVCPLADAKAQVAYQEFSEAMRWMETASIDVPTPAGTSAGDLLVVAVATDENSVPIAPPGGEGWTEIDVGASGADVTLGVFWKIAGASEPASHTFSYTCCQQAYAWMMRFTGHDPVNPINASAQLSTADDASPPSPSVTTTVANTLILRLGGFDDRDIVVDDPGLPGHTPITMDASSAFGSGQQVSGGAGYVLQPAVGPSGTSNFSLTEAEQSRTVTVAIAPAGAVTGLVRYWIDEAPSGQGPTLLLDAESNPINMPLGYVGPSPVWQGGSGGNRHLRFNGTDGTDTGGGVVDVNGTKIDALHGATSATLEVKYMMDSGSCVGNDSRIFGISDGDISASGWLAIRERALRDVLQVQWAGQSVGIYALETGCPITSASVVHWVIDTENATPADRIRAYINGVRATVTAIEASSLPSQNETIDLGAGTRRMFVGRPHTGIRTLRGRIWYAALYHGVMSEVDIAANAAALNAADDNNSYGVSVSPDGLSVVRQAGTGYSQDFTVTNSSSVSEDFDLLSWTDPSSSFISIDSITGGGVSQGARPDSARAYGVEASADSTVTVWYTIATSTDGRIDTLYLTGRSTSNTSQSDAAWIEIEFESITLAVTPDGADTLQLLPTGSSSSPSYEFTITNTSAVSESFDLLAFPGDTLDTVLTVDSITGPNVSGGVPGDSARTGAISASADDSAFVWFSVATGTPGALDSLYLMGRSVSQPSAADSGWVFIELLQPNIRVSRTVVPGGNQPPGTDLTYTITITNDGNYDAKNVVTIDSLAVEVDFQVGSVVNNLPAGVNVSVEYSDDDGVTWTYTPVSAGCGAPASYDRCVTNIRWTLLNDLSYLAPENTGDFEYVARIR